MLKYKLGWTAAQRAEADLKVKILTEGETIVSQANRSGTSAASRYRRAGNDIPAGNDIDHAIDLQLGGLDTLSNSLLIKVLMFVLIDGWSLVLRGVLGSFG